MVCSLRSGLFFKIHIVTRFLYIYICRRQLGVSIIYKQGHACMTRWLVSMVPWICLISPNVWHGCTWPSQPRRLHVLHIIYTYIVTSVTNGTQFHVSPQRIRVLPCLKSAVKIKLNYCSENHSSACVFCHFHNDVIIKISWRKQIIFYWRNISLKMKRVKQCLGPMLMEHLAHVFFFYHHYRARIKFHFFWVWSRILSKGT